MLFYCNVIGTQHMPTMTMPNIIGRNFLLRSLMALPIFLLLALMGPATGVAQLTIFPERLDFTDCIEAGKDTITKTVLLSNRSLTDSIRIDGIFTEKQGNFRAFQSVRSFGPGTSTEIEVKFTPRFPGKYVDKLTIQWSVRGVEQRRFEVQLVGQAQFGPWMEPYPRVQGSPGPPRATLDTVALADTSFRQLVLRNTSNCFPFTINQMEIEGDNASEFFLARAGVIPRTIPPNGFDTILIGVVPKSINGDPPSRILRTHLTFNKGDKWRRGEVLIDVVVVRTKYVIRPEAVDFRDVSVGAISPEQEVAIAVLGSSDKDFTSIEMIGNNAADFRFVAPPLPFRLNRGMDQARVIRVECAPTATGARYALLRLTTADGDRITIPLQANGKDDGFAIRPLLVDAGLVTVGDSITLADTILISKLQPPPASIVRVRIDGPDSAMFAVIGNLPADFTLLNPTHRFGVKFAPTRPGDCFARAHFLLPNNNRIRVELRGKGAAANHSIVWVPTTTDYGNVRVDSSLTIRVGLVNRGNTQEKITTVEMEGAAPSDFTILPLNLPATLHPVADTLWADVRFTPSAGGLRTASIRATAESGATAVQPIQGTGEVRDLTVSPSIIDFGEITNGSSITAANTIILTNTGSATIAVTEATIEGDTAGVFTLQGATDVKLTQGSQTTYSLTFAPNSVGSFSAGVVITLSEGDPIRIPIAGRSVPRPAQLQLINAPAEFGAVQIATNSQPVRIGITNVGEATETINSVAFAQNPDNVFAAQLPAAAQQLRGMAADTLWISTTFAPVAAQAYQGELLVDGVAGTTRIQLRGEGTTSGIGADPIRLELGTVMQGTPLAANNALAVKNRTTNATEVLRFRWIGGDSTAFTVAGNFPATVAPSGTEFYSVTFLPEAIRGYQAEGLFLLKNGGSIPVTITGSGGVPPVIYLDSAYRKVNERFDLRLYTSAFPGTAAASGGFAARIRFNPTALLLHEVTGRGISWKRLSAGVVEITSTDPSALANVELARLTMEGLVTGKPENEIAVEECTLLASGATLTTMPGKVFLDGCQIDQAGLFGRPAAIKELFPSPLSSEATLRFTAPKGTQPVAVILDPTGREVGTLPLPEGTGEEMETTLTFSTVGSGFYFLELRLGTQRSVVPVMISR